MIAEGLEPGTILDGKYRIEELIGEGGHGVVVSATHLALSERVAIKLLRTEHITDNETLARFVREARAAVRIKGEHVTRVLDVGSLSNGTPYMVMEHLEGSDLGTLVDTRGAIDVPTAVDYVLQACEALAEAHRLGIVHRDIKPSNLFLTTRPDGTACVKVLDFGISKTVPTADGVEVNLTQTQTVIGSPQYMAPEQMRSSRKVDGRTDIWALGATLFELLLGRPPFHAQTLAELFAMILQDATPSISEVRPDVPRELDAVIARCLEKQPEGRYVSVADLAQALAPFASPLGSGSIERIHRLGRASHPSFPGSGSFPRPEASSSAQGLNISRTERTEPPARSRSLLIVGGSSLATLGVVGIILVALALRGRASHPSTAPTATINLAASPPETPSAAPPSTGPLPDPRAEAPSAPSFITPPPTASSQAKANKRPSRPVVSTPNSAAAPPAPSPTTPPTGVASSRYD